MNEATDARNEEKIEEVVMVPVYAPKNGRLQCKTVVAGSVPQDTRSNDCKLSPYFVFQLRWRGLERQISRL